MQRLHIHFPEPVIYTTSIRVRITDLNYGGHLGNDKLISILHEARYAFLQSLGYSELNVEGKSIIMSDLAVEYKAEAFAGELIQIEMAADGASRVGFDLYYRCSRAQELIALAKTGILFFDYKEKKVVSIPEKFTERIGI